MDDLAGPKPAPGPDQPPIPVRLVTLTASRAGDRRQDLPRLARVLADADADVVCLQDVDRSEDGDQALLLSRALDMQLAWGPAVDAPRPDGAAPEAGNALLSRLPILVSSVHPLPGGGEPSSALQTMVELDGGALWVTAAHLTTGSAQERAAQVAALAELHSEPMETGVVVGDFAADPDAPELAALRARFSDARDRVPDRADRHRGADQVWVSPGVAVTAARVLDGDGAGSPPLVVDLAVRSGV